jgi:hypothetical protein
VLKGLATDNNCGSTDRIKNLMKHLYEKYPPNNTAHTAGDTTDENLKKTQLATIMHYHSDKQVCAMLYVLLNVCVVMPLRSWRRSSGLHYIRILSCNLNISRMQLLHIMVV